MRSINLGKMCIYFPELLLLLKCHENVVFFSKNIQNKLPLFFFFCPFCYVLFSDCPYFLNKMLSIYLSIYLSTQLSIYLSIYIPKVPKVDRYNNWSMKISQHMYIIITLSFMVKYIFLRSVSFYTLLIYLHTIHSMP